MEKNKEILQDKQLPISLKKQVMDQCILPTMTYGCQTWSLNKQTTNKLRTAQRAMERKMLDLKLKDKIPCSEIRKRTKFIDIIEYTLKQKWKWAGHIARLEDNRWTKRCTEWQPRRRKRSRGRPSRRWQDDITEKEGTTWIRKSNRQTTMEDIDGGLHPAVDGQSLDEDEDPCIIESIFFDVSMLPCVLQQTTVPHWSPHTCTIHLCHWVSDCRLHVHSGSGQMKPLWQGWAHTLDPVSGRGECVSSRLSLLALPCVVCEDRAGWTL